MSKIDKGKNKAMKLRIHVTHNASPRNAIINIPSRIFVSFSCTNALITLLNGNNNEMIINKANKNPTAPQKPLLVTALLGKWAKPRVLTGRHDKWGDRSRLGLG